MNIIFGTDGWRGLLDKEVNEETISLVAQAFAHYITKYKANSSVAVAFDGRKNSKLFAEIFSEVLSGNEMNVHLSDSIIPTPVLSFYVKKNNFDAGVMITASHNPSNYNGVKFKSAYGGPFFTEETLEVEKLIGKSAIKKNKLTVLLKNFVLPYEEQIESLIDFSLIKKINLPPLVDSMGGAGANLIESLLRKNNIKSKTIFSPPDENFYYRSAEPIKKNLAPLRESLLSNNHAIGIANDGDADRIGIMDEKGEWISAQETILLLADYLFKQKNIAGGIVKTSSVTNKLKHFFETEARSVLDVQVGFKYIAEEMIKNKIAFGCEESGGFGYGFHIPERDGIFSAFLFLEMLGYFDCDKISQLTLELKKHYGEIYYSRIDDHDSTSERIYKLDKIYNHAPNKINLYNIDELKSFKSSRGIINGLKFYLEGQSRWLLIRVSETEPVVRFYAEANSNDEVNSLLNEGKKLFNEV